MKKIRSLLCVLLTFVLIVTLFAIKDVNAIEDTWTYSISYDGQTYKSYTGYNTLDITSLKNENIYFRLDSYVKDGVKQNVSNMKIRYRFMMKDTMNITSIISEDNTLVLPISFLKASSYTEVPSYVAGFDLVIGDSDPITLQDDCALNIESHDTQYKDRTKMFDYIKTVGLHHGQYKVSNDKYLNVDSQHVNINGQKFNLNVYNWWCADFQLKKGKYYAQKMYFELYQEDDYEQSAVRFDISRDTNGYTDKITLKKTFDFGYGTDPGRKYEETDSWKINNETLAKVASNWKQGDVFVFNGNIADTSVFNITVKDQTYTGKAIEPAITVKYLNETLEKDVDYTVVYSNNTNVGTATVKITGKSPFSGTISKTFKITKASYTPTTKAYSGTYDGKSHTITISGVKSGSTIKYRTSPDGTWTTKKPSRTNAGTTTVYYQITNPNCNTITGSQKITIAKRNVSTLTYSKLSNKTYTGKQIKYAPTVKYGSKALKSGTDYTLSYGANKSTGKATVKITGKGNYTGTITKTFYIVPKAPSSLKVTAGKKSVKVSYKKSTGASGYQIAYSTSKNSGYKYITTTSLSKTISKLTSKKTYYIKVRAYKTVGKTKYYGSYTSMKSIKVK